MARRKNKRLLYLAMGDTSKQNIAPSIRMSAFKKAFKELLNKDFYCIEGKLRERNKKVKNFILSGEWKNFSSLYIESSNRGLSCWDAILILLFKFKRRQISVFIRDVYPFFFAGWKNTNFNGKIANILWIFSIIFYKFTVTKMYFPAQSMFKFLKFKNSATLPPGIYNDIPDKPVRINSLFYAGGLASPYNLSPILEAVERLAKEMDISFTIYCRETDRKHISEWLNRKWLNIEHKNLKELEFKPSICVTSSDDKYQKIGRNVKIMDYIRLGAPIIISDAYENSLFIKKHNIGLIADVNSADSFYNRIKTLLIDEQLYTEILNNVNKLRNSEEITWQSRARKVLQDFGWIL